MGNKIGYFIDVQGTLISDKDKQPISGAIEFVNRLQDEKIPFVIVTNNTKMDSDIFLNYLQNLGFNINKNQYLDPLMILDETLKSKDLLAFGTEQFLNNLQNRKYNLTSSNPKTVLLGVKHDYTYSDYSQILETILSNPNIDLIGMHGTSIYVKNRKRYPGVGAILEMVKFATSRDYTVIGKPSKMFYQKALKIIGFNNFQNITIISDDLKGDLKGAKQLGMKTVFVLSGKFKSIDEVLPYNSNSEIPDLIYKNIGLFKLN
jgi:NagD protein